MDQLKDLIIDLSSSYHFLAQSIDFFADKAFVDFGYPKYEFKIKVLKEYVNKSNATQIMIETYNKIQKMVPSETNVAKLALFSQLYDFYAQRVDTENFSSDSNPEELLEKTFKYRGNIYKIADFFTLDEVTAYVNMGGYLEDEFEETFIRSKVLQLDTLNGSRYRNVTDNEFQQKLNDKYPHFERPDRNDTLSIAQKRAIRSSIWGENGKIIYEDLLLEVRTMTIRNF